MRPERCPLRPCHGPKESRGPPRALEAPIQAATPRGSHLAAILIPFKHSFEQRLLTLFFFPCGRGSGVLLTILRGGEKNSWSEKGRNNAT